MTSNHPPLSKSVTTIYVKSTISPEHMDRLRVLIPGVRLLCKGDIKNDPELLAQVEILYGELKDGDWKRAHNLRWVQVAWVGVDRVLTPAFIATGLPLYKSPAVNARCMIESIFGMILVHTRRLQELWDAQRKQEWALEAVEPRQQTLEGKTLGLLGVGDIGSRAAEVARAFQMRVIGCRHSGAPHPACERIYTPSKRHEFLAQCDVLLNTLPLTPQTNRFLGDDEIAALPEGAIYCGFGRSRTADTKAIIEALQSGHLGAALLDVYDTEPLPAGDPLWTAPNCYVSPHCSGHYHGRWEKSGEMFVENVERYLTGRPLAGGIDVRRGY